MYKTEIQNKCGGTWFLMIKKDGQVIRFWSFIKLIEAMETACILKLHIDNMSELPLKQYQ